VKATVNVVEGGVYSKLVSANALGPLSMIGWYSLGDADFATIWFAKAGKRTVWINDEYESLFTDARSTTDTARRIKDYQRMMEIMQQEDPAIFLFGLPSLYGVSTAISGFHAASDKVLRLSKVEMK
jgi:peptide/nickel transport system substrate-binding protein